MNRYVTATVWMAIAFVVPAGALAQNYEIPYQERTQTIFEQAAPAPNPPLNIAADAMAQAPEPAPAADAAPGLPSQDQYFTLDELMGEMRRLTWTKGDFTITPYGTLWANTAWETSRSVSGDFVLYVLPPRVGTNEAFNIDAKSTRLGVDVLGPRLPCWGNAQTGGKVEIDFQRNFDTENRSGVLLRHAYLEAKNDEFRLLAGQTWDVISPLYPGLLMYTVGWDGGNIGYRRAQARGERYFAISDNFLLITQGSLNVDILSDTVTGFAGDHSGWPLLEGRLGVVLGERGPGSRPIEMGISSHVGEIILLPDAPAAGLPRRTWSLNADVRVPITPHIGVQGELWMGENLATFFGGIGQGIDVTSADLHTIYSRGGWADVWYDWTDRLHSHVGYSIDDPIDSDITKGRTYNAFMFANLSYDVTPKFLVGFEFTSWRTIWKDPDVNVPDQNFNFVAKYGF